MQINDGKDDVLTFRVEDEVIPGPDKLEEWLILIADDDEQVHKVTELALTNVEVQGRPLRFIHAYTGREAFLKVQQNPGIVLILLDVVMESDDAGLQLVRRIRDELGNDTVRIILRTGQPGYAPELEVIQHYDINDYKLKSEFTRTRLITAITTTIRSYEQIRNSQQVRKALELIIEGTANLLLDIQPDELATGVMDLVLQVIPEFESGSLYCHDRANGEVALLSRLESSGGNVRRVDAIENGGAGNSIHATQVGGPGSSSGATQAGGAGGAGGSGGATQVGGAGGSSGATQVGGPRGHFSGAALAGKLVSAASRSEGLTRAFETGQNIFLENEAVLALHYDESTSYYLALNGKGSVSDSETRIIRVLTSTAQIAFRNVELIERLKRHAYLDQLTGLPNKRKFSDLIDSLPPQRRESCVLAIVDIDSFSEINNSLGSEVGNILLREVATRISGIDIPDSLVSRISGDTFGIFAPEKQFKPQLVLSAFEDPIIVRDTELPVHCSMGIVSVDASMTGEDAIKFANMAMKRSKQDARGRYQYFNKSMEAAALQRLQISRELKPALLASEFFLQFQPQVNLETGAAVGAECLIRWRKPGGEIVPPGSFIPIAEESGFINDLGRWVLIEAVKLLAAWQKQGLDLRLAVNVSLRQLHNPGFAAMVTEIIGSAGISPSSFEIELTESVLMQDSELVVDILKRLKKVGIGIAIDDFGTGFSSLSYLLKLPIDRLKVDRSFVLNLENDKRAYMLTELVVNMGRNLGLEIIAEGVETEKQANIVNQLGCHEVQGYHYGKPMDRSDFESWLLKRTPTPAKTGAN